MKNKTVKIGLLLLISAMCVFAGEWYVLYGNAGLMLMHFILTALFCYYLPAVVFRRGDYRAMGYVISIILGFMALTMLYLEPSSEIGIPDGGSWSGVLQIDAVIYLAVSSVGAIVFGKFVK